MQTENQLVYLEDKIMDKFQNRIYCILEKDMDNVYWDIEQSFRNGTITPKTAKNMMRDAYIKFKISDYRFLLNTFNDHVISIFEIAKKNIKKQNDGLFAINGTYKEILDKYTVTELVTMYWDTEFKKTWKNIAADRTMTELIEYYKKEQNK
jgi:uncharacterized protein YchJ